MLGCWERAWAPGHGGTALPLFTAFVGIHRWPMGRVAKRQAFAAHASDSKVHAKAARSLAAVVGI